MNTNVIATLATLILAGVFVFPYPRNVLTERSTGFRSFVSFAAGLSLAYVFIDLLPEFSGLGDELLEERGFGLPFPEYFVYMAALLGFVVFYGLERLVRWTSERPSEGGEAGGASLEADDGRVEAEGGRAEAEGGREYLIKLSGLAGYAALVLYLMTAGLREGSEEGLVAYVIAMTFHFLAMRHSIRYEYPEPYHRGGAWVLTLACIAGAALGAATRLPVPVEALLLGFLGGMLIMNTTVMELPTEKEGRFGMFLAGSVAYAVLLMMI